MEPGKQFALRTPDGDYYHQNDDGTWSITTSLDVARRFSDDREALTILEALRAEGRPVDLYTNDEHGEFAVAVA